MTELIKSYSELIKIPKYLDRYKYLKIGGSVGEYTFASHRYLNQVFYTSPEWKSVRVRVINRDCAMDMGVKGHDIFGAVIVHHINPITVDDLIYRNPIVLDLENLICVKCNTHKAIHYGSEDLLDHDLIVRMPNDTCPWKNLRKELH